MAGFNTVDEGVQSWSVHRKGQRLTFNKTAAAASSGAIPQTLWTATGLPAAGAYGTQGRANGRVLTDATTGAFAYGNAAGGESMHLFSFGAATITTNGTGSFILVDRISDILLALNDAGGTLTGVDATSRLDSTTAPGSGALLWLEVQSVLGTATTLSFGYTNQLGTGSRSTGNIVSTASQAASKSINSNLWQPLQAGDSGIRTLDSVTLVSGSGTGSYAAALVKHIATIPLLSAEVYTERDYVVEIPNLEKIFDDSCLALMWVPAASVTATFFGEIRICAR
jgi:hypothetical protein